MGSICETSDTEGKELEMIINKPVVMERRITTDRRLGSIDQEMSLFRSNREKGAAMQSPTLGYFSQNINL